jgi:hypothetical protein
MTFAGAAHTAASRASGRLSSSAPGISLRDGNTGRTPPMADNRKYYYLKLKENFFDSDSIVLLEDMNFVFQYPLEAVLKIAEKWRQIAA